MAAAAPQDILQMVVKVATVIIPQDKPAQVVVVAVETQTIVLREVVAAQDCKVSEITELEMVAAGVLTMQ